MRPRKARDSSCACASRAVERGALSVGRSRRKTPDAGRPTVLKVRLSRRPYSDAARPRIVGFPHSKECIMQAKFHLKQITVALAAAGFGLAVGAGYNRLDAPALSLANAAVSPPAVTSPVASTAAARLPDFTAL